MDTFSFASTSPLMRYTQVVGVRDNCQFEIVSVAVCLIIFRAYMNILFIIKVKILELTIWSCRSPIMLIIDPRMGNKY